MEKEDQPTEVKDTSATEATKNPDTPEATEPTAERPEVVESAPAKSEDKSEDKPKEKPAEPTPAEPVSSPAPAKPAKSPMDPKVKKALIIFACVGGGIFVICFVLALLAVTVFNVDYGESYRAIRDLKDSISEIASSYDCDDVVDYVSSDYVSEKTYNSYVESCQKSFAGVKDAIEALGSTSGVQHNPDLKELYDQFLDSFNTNVPDVSSIEDKLPLYQAWHTFLARVDDLSAKDSDSVFENAVAPLLESGNDTLKNYGENWLTEVKPYRAAYKAYYDNSKSGSTEYKAMTEARKKFNDWVEDNAPDLEKLIPLSFADTRSIRSPFESLYEAIADNYAKNYDPKSGDCSKLFDSVICY